MSHGYSFINLVENNHALLCMICLIHDLAHHISEEFCVCLEDDKVQKVTDKAQSFSLL